jgi:hypothetical protein
VPKPKSNSPRLFIWLTALFLAVTGINSQAAVTLSLGANFTGSTFGVNSSFLPPDANGAIGPGRFMEFINGTVAVYNKTNGASVQRKSNAAFWADAGLIISSDALTTDPRVIYDSASQRWFATQVDFDANAADPTSEANNFLFAVSTTASPTGTWKGFKFQADPDNGFFADFPTLGLDGNAVYISGDFYSAGEISEGPGLVSIPKADLIAATPTVTNLHWHGVMDAAVRGEVMQPAICFDGSAGGIILTIGDIGTDSSPHSNVVWTAVQNAGGLSPTLSAAASVNVLPYQVPDNPDLGVPNFSALQPDGSTTLLANDARLSAKVYAVGGVLYAVHNTELNGRIVIRWYRIRAADHALLEQGTIADPNRDLFFPSIAANQYGVVVIGCNGSGSATFVSSYAYVGETRNGQTTFGSSILLKAGVGSYHDINEVLADLFGDPVTPSRWGDYSSMSVDPADPTRFWTIQMYPSAVDPDTGGTWSTQITEIIATTPPTLTIAPAGTNVLVFWPLYAAAYQLQSNTNLDNAAGWTLLTPATSNNGFIISALVSQTTAATFFRLKSP